MKKWLRRGSELGLISAFSVSAAATVSAQTMQQRMDLPIAKTPYTNSPGISFHDSTPQKIIPVTAPPGAPNVLIILIDDAGYGQTSTFGAPIPTPTLDSLAENGLRYTRFHVAALCAPSRAALLTGRNTHSVGMGNLPAYSNGYAGYDADIPKSAAFLSETLRLNGYATSAFGKWHLLPDWESSSSGPFNHWPTGEGFDYYYGFIGTLSDQWQPNLYEDTLPVAMVPPPGREGNYTLNDALADKAIQWIDTEKSITPDKPFFIYYAPGATHCPLQAPKAWIDKFRGKFDMGWDKYREMVFARQKELGVIPADTVLTPRPAELQAWDSLTPAEKKVAAREMEVFAGYMAQTDYEIGRVIDAIVARGQLDNTLIFYIAGDNGASLEGGLNGAFSVPAQSNHADETAEEILSHLDDLGGPDSYPAYPAAWGWAGNTPFQWGKQFASHLGATRDPLVISWPLRIKDLGGMRSQFQHLIDVAPTVLEAAHIPQPVSVDGAVQQPIEGVSMMYTFDDANAPERHHTQYFEICANRSIYSDGWIAGARNGSVPWAYDEPHDFTKQPWELYHIDQDYSEANNLAAAQPEKVQQMQELFMDQARKYNVLPMGPCTLERITPSTSPSLNDNRKLFTYTGDVHLIDPLAPQVRNHSYTITADVEIPASGAEGVLVAQGGHFGGYALYIQDGYPTYIYNYSGRKTTMIAAKQKLPKGQSTIQVLFNYDGGGLGKGATITLIVNGKVAGTTHLAQTSPVTFSAAEMFDTNQDTGSPVGNYSAPFRFTGTLRKLVVDVAPGQLNTLEKYTLKTQEQIAHDSEQ